MSQNRSQMFATQLIAPRKSFKCRFCNTLNAVVLLPGWRESKSDCCEILVRLSAFQKHITWYIYLEKGDHQSEHYTPIVISERNAENVPCLALHCGSRVWYIVKLISVTHSPDLPLEHRRGCRALPFNIQNATSHRFFRVSSHCAPCPKQNITAETP